MSETTSGFQGHNVFKHRTGSSGGTHGQLAVNMRVRVYPGTEAESRGVIVEDFGEMDAQPVDLGGHHSLTRPDGGQWRWTPAIWCSLTPTNWSRMIHGGLGGAVIRCLPDRGEACRGSF